MVHDQKSLRTAETNKNTVRLFVVC